MCSICDQYKVALEGRREDSSRYWTVFSVMSAVNGAMLAFTNSDEPLIPNLLTSAFGVLLCIVWLSLQLRLAAWVRWWEIKLATLESHIADAERLFTGRTLDSKNPLRVGFSTRMGGVILSLLFMAAWLVVGISHR